MTYKQFSDFDIIRKNYIEDIKEYFNGNIPDYLIEKLNSEDYIYDYILENLKSHDTKKLKDKILDKFLDKYYDIKFHELTNTKESYKVKGFILSSDRFSNDINKDKDFQNLLQFYGYYVTEQFNENLIIMPTYPENVSNFVYKENNGILYHFTSGKHVDEILKKGLRIKKASYREYPERIYLYSCGYKKLEDIPDLKKFIKKVVSIFNLKRYGLSIFKINLNKISSHNIEFYTDELMDEKEAVFTYNNIPKECITKININNVYGEG